MTPLAAHGQTPADYNQRMPVQISNGGGIDLPDAWIPVEVPIGKLRAGGYMGATVLATEGTAQSVIPAFAQDNRAGVDDAWWFVAPETLEGASTTDVAFHLGGDRTETAFPLDSRLGVTAADATALNITKQLNIAADVDLSNRSDGWIVEKDNQYALGVVDGKVEGQVTTIRTLTQGLDPNGVETSGGWTASSSTPRADWYKLLNSSNLVTGLTTTAQDSQIYINFPAAALDGNIERVTVELWIACKAGFADCQHAGKNLVSLWTMPANSRDAVHVGSPDIHIQRAAGALRKYSEPATPTKTVSATTPLQVRFTNVTAPLTIAGAKLTIRFANPHATTVSAAPVSGRTTYTLTHSKVGQQWKLTLSEDGNTLASTVSPDAFVVPGLRQPLMIGTGDLRGSLYGLTLTGVSSASSTPVKAVDLDVSPASVRRTSGTSSGQSWAGTITNTAQAVSGVSVVYALMTAMAVVDHVTVALRPLEFEGSDASGLSGTTDTGEIGPAIVSESVSSDLASLSTAQEERGFGLLVDNLFVASATSGYGAAFFIALTLFVVCPLTALIAAKLKGPPVVPIVTGAVGILVFTLMGMIAWGVFVVYLFWSSAYAALAGRLR